MASKSTIINVTVDEKINTVYVDYSSGFQKLYEIHHLPKTVQKWLEENKKKEAPLGKPELTVPYPNPVKVCAEASEQNPVKTVQFPVRSAQASTEAHNVVRATVPLPEREIALKMSPVACTRLVCLFLAGVIVYMAWWYVQAVIVTVNTGKNVAGRACWIWKAAVPVITTKCLEIAEAASDAWDFRKAILASM